MVLFAPLPSLTSRSDDSFVPPRTAGAADYPASAGSISIAGFSLSVPQGFVAASCAPGLGLSARHAMARARRRRFRSGPRVRSLPLLVMSIPRVEILVYRGQPVTPEQS